jgi:elongation factor Ts
MATITTDQIKALRDQTGVSIMQCKRALEEAGGDAEKAVIILRKHSKAVAEKKSGRTLRSGAVQAYLHSTGDVGAMVLLLCESDFVAKNKDFTTLAYSVAMQIAAMPPEFLTRADVTPEALAKAREVFQADVEGKPKELQEKILEGKLDAYFKDKILIEQAFIKDPELTIEQLIESAIQKFGEKIEVGEYSRFSARG